MVTVDFFILAEFDSFDETSLSCVIPKDGMLEKFKSYDSATPTRASSHCEKPIENSFEPSIPLEGRLTPILPG